ncbi:immunoglobulin-like domain-containing protein, partial [Parendozoicomonas haliclonae]|uniref:immunoglobulin-like domain-containing protein n=1 Tax=Parendozoicomonas haliclonae TaxID=1960125 RepID=UPI0013FD33F6
EVVTAITDDQDEVTITLTATPTTSEDGGSITYTATLSNVDGLPVANHNGLTVTLANQQQITIQAGATSGTVDLAIDRDDVWVENGDTVANSITGVTGGSEFENLTFSEEEVVTAITDDQDEVTITLTATPTTSEDGGSIT